MRLTLKLCQQHLGWTFKKHWQVQGKRVIRDTGATAELQRLGIEVKDVNDILYPKKPIEERLEFVGNKPIPIPEDETHPNWHANPCYEYGDKDLLLEGMAQAQVLTNTIVMGNLPKNIEESIVSLRLPKNIDANVQSHIMASHVFDAEQVKLPKVKLPERPAYKLPRVYGISIQRRMRLLTNKLIAECEKWAPRTTTADRWLFDNVKCNATLSINESDILKLRLGVEKLIASRKALEPVKAQYQGDLPDLFPLKPTISIPKKHIYSTEIEQPLPDNIKSLQAHTIISHFNHEEVKNLHETSVTDSQWQSRTLLKAFAVAGLRARQLQEVDESGRLAKPVVVQSIQTDGCHFHFGVFQLNTLKVAENGDSVKNYWFHLPHMEMFKLCDYVKGKPTLEGYNKDAFRILNAFYNA